uniref:Uncharacterized protein n=1 Tax=Arundo donax TaxID=35708 RepID=A0A0A9GCH4_ARUDO
MPWRSGSTSPAAAQQQETAPLLRSSRVTNRDALDGEERWRRTCSKSPSSQGSAMGPAQEPEGKPYSSSACRSSSRNTGWFRCAVRTKNRRDAPPTHTATCPAGTTDSPAATAARAAARDRHRRSVCRSQTMYRILLLLFAIGARRLSCDRGRVSCACAAVSRSYFVG